MQDDLCTQEEPRSFNDTQGKKKKEEVIVCREDYWPLIPDGKYQAVCYDYNCKPYQGKARRMYLNFEIISPGEYQGKKLFMVFNIPVNGKPGRASRYYKTWVMVNGWRHPSRNTQMSPRLFLKKAYEVETKTVKPQFNGGTPEELYYSKVENILYVLTGTIN